jgi:acyl-[acyl-carrier-protein]-phospholipid O-acyltransferase/long-chain-fatty-acid--[acyl-carrier-protein] ligase
VSFFPLWAVNGLSWLPPAVAGAILAGLVVLFFFRPHVLLRGVFWLLSHSLYRVRVRGRQHVPTTGPALLVCNHVSYIDALLLVAAQRRPIRFVVWAPFTRVPFLRVLLRLARVIPVDASAGPRAIVHALRTAGEALANGELVCIFAEGTITRTGFLLPFHRGFEQVLKRTPAPVIPVCLDHVWGSIFSNHGGRMLWKWPQRLPYPVTVAFGEPMPATVAAVEVRQAVQRLSAECAVARSHKRRPVHREFVRMAARHPFRPCIIDSNNRTKVYKYGEVLVGAWIMADFLRPVLGDEKMVGIWMPPGAGGAFANIALALLGKVPVNLNYTASPAAVQSAIRQCGIRHVLTARPFTAKVPLPSPLPSPPPRGEGVLSASPPLSPLGGEGRGEGAGTFEPVHLEDFRKRVTTAMRVRKLLAVLLLPSFVLDRWLLKLGRHGPEDLATVIFSSGSTGDPKGVMLAQRNISANTESVIQAIDPRPSDRILGVLPFFHSFGYTVTLWVPLQIGMSMVFHPDPRQPKEIGELCRTLACSIYLSTATFLRLCLRRCEPNDFKTLRILICGAEKLPQSLAQEFGEKFGVLPLEGYGCTELSPVAAANVPNWDRGGIRQMGHKSGTIGQPVPGVAARVVDPDSFQPLPQGKEGLLLMYGGNVMQGYLGRPDLTAAAVIDGWYKTGDMARVDEDGFITLTGRLARFAKIGGEMVPLEKIEDSLHQIVNTAERLFAVTSVPDEKKGERVVVLHTMLNGVSLRQVCQDLPNRGLPNLGLPGERDFFEIAEMPVLGTGKLDLKRVKELALERARA